MFISCCKVRLIILMKFALHVFFTELLLVKLIVLPPTPMNNDNRTYSVSFQYNSFSK